MKNLNIKMLTLAMILISGTLLSQEKWSAEIRPGVNFPTSDFVDAEIKTGFGFEAVLGYRFMEHLGVTAGWGYNTFNLENSSFEFDETGYTFGLQFIHPIGTSEKVSYLLRAGGIYNHLEIENSSGDVVEDSGHGLGWELGAGINYDLGSNWNVRPQLGYRSLSRDIELSDLNSNVDVNYFIFGIGIAKTF
ncbi:outer membrane beta-barrel protein [Muriicola sp. SD30]|uniref:outer membrane beta-barrel protein n=1 Tax=Muriicola sp. SD30 TaxID=3240936 RepID=UPI00350F0840